MLFKYISVPPAFKDVNVLRLESPVWKNCVVTLLVERFKVNSEPVINKAGVVKLTCEPD